MDNLLWILKMAGETNAGEIVQIALVAGGKRGPTVGDRKRLNFEW